MAATRISDATTITPAGTEFVPLGNGTSKVKATALAVSQLNLKALFVTFTGPTTAVKTFTLPDASATLLYSGGALGTPSSGVATNLTGTAAGLTAGGVTTNANLTGPITSVGNTTSVAAQTGTGSTFVMQASPAFTGTPTLGTLGFSDTGILFSLQSSTNSFNQVTIQNSSNGATASTNFIVDNDQATASTHYGEFGMNSSGFTGSGAWNIAGAVYLDAISDDLAIGTLANKPLHFFVNSGTTDAVTISGAGNFSFNQPAQASGWAPMLTITPGAHTAYTATTEFIDYDFKNRTATWVDGTTATQRFAYFRGNTVNKTTTSATFTDIYTAYFDPSIAGSGVTFTRNWAAGFGGAIMVGGNIQIKAGGTGQIGTFDNNGLNLYSNSTIRGGVSATGLWSFINAPSTGNNTWFTFTQAAQTSGIPIGLLWTGGAHTNLTTATEQTDWNINLSAIMKIADGTIATQRTVRIQGRTYTPQTSALTLTEVSTLEVNPPVAGSGTTFSNGATLGYAIKSTGNVALATVGNKLFIAEGAGGSVGQTTLVSGTKAITITGLTTASRAFVSLVAQGGTSTAVYEYIGVCTTNTLTITAITVTGTTVSTDTSILNYFIIN